MGTCDSCEDVKPNSSQDWTKFTTEQPTEIAPVVLPRPERFDWRAAWAQFAAPVVRLQDARDAPAPGAGLAGLSEALTTSDAFRDITGLAGNQENAIRTYLSNQENAKAFAEMAKSMAMQQHNSENADSIKQSIQSAHESGAIDEDQFRRLTQDHLGQLIDGGTRSDREARQEEAQAPSLASAARERIERGDPVRATRTETTDSVTETVDTTDAVSSGELTPVHYDVPLIPQPNKTSCWAAAMAMVESFRRSEESRVEHRRTTVRARGPARLFARAVLHLGSARHGPRRLADAGSTGARHERTANREEWHRWLSDYGPLYVTVDGEPTHAVVVRGMRGDGTSGGSEVDVLNPWDTNVTFDADPTEFHPANNGRQQTYSVDDLNRRITTGQLTVHEFYGRWKVLYMPALAPVLASGTPSAGAGRGIPLQVVNLFYEFDDKIDYEVSLISAVYSQDALFSGRSRRRLPEAVPDGDYTVIVTPSSSGVVPADWSGFNPVGNPDRVFLEARASISVRGGRVTDVRENTTAEVVNGGLVDELPADLGKGGPSATPQQRDNAAVARRDPPHRKRPRPAAALHRLRERNRRCPLRHHPR